MPVRPSLTEMKRIRAGGICSWPLTASFLPILLWKRQKLGMLPEPSGLSCAGNCCGLALESLWFSTWKYPDCILLSPKGRADSLVTINKCFCWSFPGGQQTFTFQTFFVSQRQTLGRENDTVTDFCYVSRETLILYMIKATGTWYSAPHDSLYMEFLWVEAAHLGSFRGLRISDKGQWLWA